LGRAFGALGRPVCGRPYLVAIPRVFVYVTLAAWALTFLGLLGELV
jgi:hypothetical protein